MNIRVRLTYALLISAGISAGAAAQSLLDQQLGPPTAPAPAPASAPATTQPAKPTPNLPPPTAKPDTPKPNTDIVSPNAVKKVDDDELLNQLLQPGTPPDPNAVKQRLKDMITRMQDTQKLLANKDPGEVTQETQRRIVSDLDVMIELARQQQQQNSSSGSSPQPGQSRQPGSPQNGQTGPGGTQAATSDPLPRGGIADPTSGDIHNRDPANWGGLPPRDRDQVSHGANEEYLSAYKDLIDRYYQALAEMGKARNR